MRRGLLAAGAVFLLVFGLHFSEELQLRSGPPSAQWSRSVALGQTDLRAELAVAPAASGAFAFWVKDGAVGFARLLPGGGLGQTGQLPETAGVTAVAASPTEPTSLFWLDGQGVSGARLDPRDGRLLTRVRITGPALSLATAGDYLVVAKPEAVVVYKTTGETGPGPAASWALPNVDRLGAWADEDGLRLVLGERESTGNLRLWFAALPPAGPAGPPLRLGRFILIHNGVTGLRVACDRDHLYVVTLQETYGQRRKYTALQAVLPRRLGLPGAPPLTAEPTFTPLALPDLPGLSALTNLVLAPSGDGDLSAAGVAAFESRKGTAYEVVTGRLTPQGFTEPVLATRSRGAASLPAWAGQDDGRMLVYQETDGFGRWSVRATGAGPAFASLNRMRRGDLASAFLETLLSLFSIFQALYYLTGTVFPGLIVMLALYVFVLTWAEHHAPQTFAAGAATYLAGKVYLLPHTFYVPDVAVLLPAWLAPLPVGQLISLGLFALGFGAVWAGWRKGRRQSPFSGLLLLAAVDLPLTLFLYTPYLR